MRILPRAPRSTPVDGAKPSTPIPPPRRPASWPRPDLDADVDPFWQPADDGLSFRLPAENPNLLRARPRPAGPIPTGYLRAVDVTAVRPGCRILDTSLDAKPARAADFDFEAAVGQNLAILADQDHAAVTR